MPRLRLLLVVISPNKKIGADRRIDACDCGSLFVEGGGCSILSFGDGGRVIETSKKPDRTSEAIGCVFTVVLWLALILHFFSDRIWDKEPALLKWFVVGFGCLVLISLLYSLVAGKRSERTIALVVLVVIALAIALGRLF